MSIQHAGDGSHELVSADGIIDGLEDFDPTTLGHPVIRIDGKHRPRPWLADGDLGPAFVDALSGQEYKELNGIVVLGMLNGRVLWPTEMDENGPMCRSYDAKLGHPQQDFPWAATPAFDRQSLKIGEKPTEKGGIVDVYQAPCEHCPLKEWGSHPAKDTPWCTLQHSYPILMPTPTAWVPSILVLQRSSIKPSNNYVAGFHREQRPMYTVTTNITLDPRTKGQNDYAVPIIKRGPATSPDDYAFFSSTFRDIKDYLRTPRGLDSVSEDVDLSQLDGAPSQDGDPTTNPQPVPHPQAVAQQAPPTPSAPPPAPPTPAPTPTPTESAPVAQAPSPAATAPATPPAAATAAPSEPAPAAPTPPPPPPQPILAPDGQTWLTATWDGSAWVFPATSEPAPAPAPTPAPAPVEVPDPFASAATPAPAAAPAATAPATPAPAPTAGDDDDEIPF